VLLKVFSVKVLVLPSALQLLLPCNAKVFHNQLLTLLDLLQDNQLVKL